MNMSMNRRSFFKVGAIAAAAASVPAVTIGIAAGIMLRPKLPKLKPLYAGQVDYVGHLNEVIRQVEVIKQR